MTIQIANELKSVLQTQDVAVVIDASHLCVSSKVIRDTGSSTIHLNTVVFFWNLDEEMNFQSIYIHDKILTSYR